MNLYASSYDDKDTIIHRLQTHISILEQQRSHSNGYFSFDETTTRSNENGESEDLEKLLQKREYELQQLREQMNEIHVEHEEKLRQTIEQLNNSEKKLSIVENERNEIRRNLQNVLDENELMKSYLTRLPSEIEYEKLRQSHRILEDQLKVSKETLVEYRQEKVRLKKQLNNAEQTIDDQQKQIQTLSIQPDSTMFNAKCLTIDERREKEKQIEDLTKLLQEFQTKLNEEKAEGKRQKYLQEQNQQTVESLSTNIAKKDQTIKELTTLLRQTRQDLDDVRLRLLVSEDEQKRLNDRLLTNENLTLAMRRVRRTIEKLFLVLDFSLEMINNESATSPDVLMLQLSTHKTNSNSNDNENENLIEMIDVENLESKLDQIVDRLLSIRSELIAQQFENDLQSNISPYRIMFVHEDQLAVQTFVASSHGNDQCGTNGLPLTPNSIVIIGRFQYLKTIEHPNLCRYIDIRKGTHERLLIVTDFFENDLENFISQSPSISCEQIQKWGQEILYALIYLQEKHLHPRNLSLKNLRLAQPDNTIKIQNYGLWFMTHFGACVSFPIGDPSYLAPECFAQDLAFKAFVQASTSPYESDITDPANPKSCVWSFGIILLELCLEKKLYAKQNVTIPISTSIRCLTLNVASALDIILRQNGLDQDERLNNRKTQHFLPLIKKCLALRVQDRPTFVELLDELGGKPYVSPIQRSLTLTLFNGVTPVLDHNLDLSDFKNLDVGPLKCRTIDQIYYLWRLAGGDLTAVLKNAALIKTSPSISKMSKFVSDQGDVYGLQRDMNTLFDETSYKLSLDELEKRFAKTPIEILHPLLEGGDIEFEKRQEEFDKTFERQPLVVRETDFEYQFHRLILFERLLASYPYQQQRLQAEARKDIPPLYRAYAWAALLGCSGNVTDVYNRINREHLSATVIRQIEVDIPRCHQYDELLSSPEGHRKMKNVLSAWIASHPDLVYWQGLDSLCAPFVYLNFNNEALAYASLTAFIPKYLKNFFLKDNSLIINEYLAVFAHLIAFHHPDLSNHLEQIGFIPDLYAIPWYLTVFAHIFPLPKIFHLWDMLLLGGSSFPLCIGIAILTELKGLLLKADFNECILLFSELPEIDIGRCVRNSIDIFTSTPRSCFYREHASDLSNYQINNDLDMDPFPLTDLKSERCPRICGNDVVEWNDLRAPTASLKTSKLILIDIRSPDEYMKAALPASINVSFEKAFDNQNRFADHRFQRLLDQHRDLVKVVIGNKNHRQSVEFANKLITNNLTRVCILHKGIDVFKTSGMLFVPTPSDLP